METSRYGVQLELSRAWVVQFAKHLVFSNHSRGSYADGRFVSARLTALWRVERGLAVCHHIPRDGRHPRDARLHARAGTPRARLAHFTDAIDLSPDAQLLHLESNPARDQRSLGKLGQTRTHGQRACASVIVETRVRLGSARAPLSRAFQSSGLFTPSPGRLSTCV